MPLEHAPTPDVSPSQESQAPSPEAMEKRDEEFNEQKGKQIAEKQERDAEEDEERQGEIEQAETTLDLAIGLENYNECVNSLHGDAKEIMNAVNTQLSEEEKSKMGIGMMEFTKTCVRSRMTRDQKELPATEMQRMNAQIFQNSIDYIIEEAQNMDNAPVDQREELDQEINEKNNREFAETTNAEALDAFDKVLNLCHEEVGKQIAAGKILSSERLRSIQERRSQKGGNDTLNTDELVLLDRIAAENLSYDLKALKMNKKMTATVRTEEGAILESPEDFVKNKETLVVTWNGQTDSVKEVAKQKNIRVTQRGEALEVHGSLYQMDTLVDAVKEAPKKEGSSEK